MPGRQAGSTIAVYARVQCQEPKKGQEKVYFSSEDDLLFISSYYLSMWASVQKIVKDKDKDNVFHWYEHIQI